MYAVIFRAEIDNFDAEYSDLSERMRELAINEYGCREFISCIEDKEEIAVSYWSSEAEIKAWKQNAEHLLAQEIGRSKWYKSYSVQITEIVREYLVLLFNPQGVDYTQRNARLDRIAPMI